jgi:hypothetical protein
LPARSVIRMKLIVGDAPARTGPVWHDGYMNRPALSSAAP